MVLQRSHGAAGVCESWPKLLSQHLAITNTGNAELYEFKASGPGLGGFRDKCLTLNPKSYGSGFRGLG